MWRRCTVHVAQRQHACCSLSAMKREQLHWVYLRCPFRDQDGMVAFFLAFPERTSFCYDSSSKERLAVKVVPMVIPCRELQKDLTPERLGAGFYLDTGPPR